MAATSYQHHHQYHDHRPLTVYNRDDDSYVRVRSQTIAKRKSAVELLQETKPLYVKSEIVLDRKQELRRSLRDRQLPNHEDDVFHSGHNSGLNSNPSPPISNHVCRSNSSNSAGGSTCALFPLPKSPRLIPPPPAFRKSTSSLQLQNKLRKLLNADSKENLLDADSATTNSNESSKIQEKDCGLSLPESPSKLKPKSTGDTHFYKSLPDLTNIQCTSPKSQLAGAKSCHCSPHSICSDKGCQNVSLSSNFSFIPFQKDNSHDFSECETSRIDRDLGNHDTDHVKMRGNSLPTSPVKSCSSYITPPPLYCDASSLLKCRPVSRSKSDVGARNLSSLEVVDIPPCDTVSLNLFFDNLGLNSEKYSSLTTPRSDASSPVYFSSAGSSIDSIGGRGSGSETSTLNPSVETVSIVERNARIIKWLCNCRKAFEQVPRLPAPQSR